VRDHLREVLGRSPDPDEVYAEAQRPKGCSVTKTRKKTLTPKWQDIGREEESEGDGRNESDHRPSPRHCTDDGVERLSQSPSAHQVDI